MGVEAWFTLGVVAAAFLALRRRDMSPDLVFTGALVLLTVTGRLRLEQAFMGFANPAVIMVGALFVVAAGMRSTGALDWLGNKLLGDAETDSSALFRLSALAAPLSAIINNTPIVAMVTPMVLQWCRQRHISPSRLLLPLSYLAILGGTCTLIGTSTNLVVNGLLAATDVQAGPAPAESTGPGIRLTVKTEARAEVLRTQLQEMHL
ncbi:MAG: SLC13 family permease, partial [Planctomycetales bacterium]